MPVEIRNDPLTKAHPFARPTIIIIRQKRPAPQQSTQRKQAAARERKDTDPSLRQLFGVKPPAAFGDDAKPPAASVAMTTSTPGLRS